MAPNLPRIEEVHADWQVLAFAIGLTLSAGIILGSFPAMRAGRFSVNDNLKQAGRSQHKGGSTRGVRRVLLVSQIALTVMLLAGAWLLGRSLFGFCCSISDFK